VTTKRREDDEHSVRGLAGVYLFRMDMIVISSNHHHTKTTPLPSRNNHLVTFFADIPHVQGEAIDGLRLDLFGCKYKAKLGASDAVAPRA
jgi:hypothetical protein